MHFEFVDFHPNVCFQVMKVENFFYIYLIQSLKLCPHSIPNSLMLFYELSAISKTLMSTVDPTVFAGIILPIFNE